MDRSSPPAKDVAGTAADERSESLAAGTASSSPTAEEAVAAYLRSLKGPQRSTGPSPGSLPADPAGTASPSAGRERRRSIRYKCEGSAEFRVEGSEVRTWGALPDISLHGCYVEATATSPVGTILNLLLEVNKIRVHVKGEVRASYPFLGMGIAYTEVAEEERARLRQLLSSLSDSQGVQPVVPSRAEPGQSQAAAPHISDPASALDALVRFFQARSMLSRQDFWELVRKSQSEPKGG